jgi:hypothetical protein
LQDDELRRQAADPDRLVEGEDPLAVDPATAEHWIGVYEEMLKTKSDLLDRLRDQMTGMSADAQRELAATDEYLLQSQTDRFRRRIAFWTKVLAGSSG